MNPATDDPGSLNRLHDIVVGPPSAWFPPAPAWSVLAVLSLIGGCLTIAWMVIYWRMNRYRRAGLAELRQLEQTQSQNPSALVELAELLKRVALVAYPRRQVASLSGEDWLRFLDHTMGTTDFSTGPGQQLARVYERACSSPSAELMQLARHWIQRHRRGAAC